MGLLADQKSSKLRLYFCCRELAIEKYQVVEACIERILFRRVLGKAAADFDAGRMTGRSKAGFGLPDKLPVVIA